MGYQRGGPDYESQSDAVITDPTNLELNKSILHGKNEQGTYVNVGVTGEEGYGRIKTDSFNADSQTLLTDILKELKKINMYLSIQSDMHFENSDII